MITCKELRQRARNSLDNKIFGKTWLFAILVFLINSAISGIAGSFTFGIGGMIVAGPLTVGTAFYFLNMIRNTDEKNNLLTIFFSFKYGKRYLLGVLTSIFTFLWSLLFVVPGIVKFFSYSLAPYIMAENPDMSANQAITESRRMMNGNKMKLFKLYLSFIGWIALCCVPVVGFVCIPWVSAYLQAAISEFYEEVKANDEII